MEDVQAVKSDVDFLTAGPATEKILPQPQPVFKPPQIKIENSRSEQTTKLAEKEHTTVKVLSLKPLPPKVPAYLSSIYSYVVTPPPVQHYPTSTSGPPVQHYPTSTSGPPVQHYPTSTSGPPVQHYPTSTFSPPHKFSVLSPVPSLYPSSTVSPADPSLPLHYHIFTPNGQPASPVSTNIYNPIFHSSTTKSPVKKGESSVRVSSLPPLRPYYQTSSTPAPAHHPSSPRPTLSSSPPPFLLTTPSPSYFPSPSSTQDPPHHQPHLNTALLDPLIQPSNKQEVAVFFAEKHKPKRKIGEVLKEFQQKTFDSFSYQKHTTPSQSIKFVTSTTPSSVFIRSPTPKLVNPYEHISPQQHSWKDAEISVNFKSQSSDVKSPGKNEREEKSSNQHSVDYPNFNPPIYSEENFQPLFLNRPVRFKQVILE